MSIDNGFVCFSLLIIESQNILEDLRLKKLHLQIGIVNHCYLRKAFLDKRRESRRELIFHAAITHRIDKIHVIWS